MAVMTKPVKRLFDLEIDEISLVDRPANQHGLVAIAKNYEGDNMPGIFDPDGNAVDEDSLEHGDVVYDQDGNEYVFVEDDEDGTSAELQSGHNYEEEPVLVGKSLKGFMSLDRGAKARAGKEWARGNKKLLTATGAAGTAGYAGGASVHKGLGESVYEALSKALNDGDRDEVISKIAQEVEVTKRENEELREYVAALISKSEDDEYIEIAKSYNLPIDPVRLGGILKSAAMTMDDEDLAELDRLLTAQSDLYEELGSNGSMATSAIMDQVEAMAMETVGKSDVSTSQAVVALFEANPAAYDEYLSEKGL